MEDEDLEEHDIDEQIMGGTEAVDGQFPWTLSVEYDGSLGWLHMCGGILIKPQYALTGAKCVKGLEVARLRAIAGLWNRTDPQSTDALVLNIDTVIIHPDYSEYEQGIPNDIAILHFSNAADLRGNIRPATLPTSDSNDFNPDSCNINGWGRFNSEDKLSQVMLYAPVPVITNQKCADAVKGIMNAAIFDTHICIMSDPPGKGLCNGDSGGPLSCLDQVSEDVEVVGVGSWTVKVEGNCNPNYPSVYVRISKYLDWINANTQ
jgi:secreted trypsin-like serine protease